MRTSPLPAVAVAALLILSGCAGLPGTDDSPPSTNDSGPSPDEFPDASAIDQSVYDRHAALLANTSFTVSFETAREKHTDLDVDIPTGWSNSSRRVLAEPGASQYLSQPNGTLNYIGTTEVQRVYSDGTSAYILSQEDNETTVEETTLEPGFVREFNESGEYYLWQDWRAIGPGGLFSFVRENVTYERRGVETFDGVDVMRYEASGVDALPDWMGEGENTTYTNFSATLLLDADGVIRHYEAELGTERGGGDVQKLDRLVATVTDVGSTDIEKPEWVSNATAGS